MAEPARASRGRVLVAEDEALTRILLIDVLEEQGFEVLEADSGEAAVELLETAEVDAAVLDVRMPGRIDGLDLAARLASERPWVKVLMSSGVAQLDARVAPLANVIGCLPKPYDPAVVAERLKRALKGA